MGNLTFNLPELRERVRGRQRDPESLHSIGLALAARGEYRRSFVFHRAAASALPENGTYLRDAGSAALAIGRLDEAERLLDDALRVGQDQAETWRQRGELYLTHCRNPEAALRCYVQAMRAGARDTETYRTVGRCALSGHTPELAISRLRDAMPADVDPCDAERSVALGLADAGNYEQAVPILSAVLRQCPDDRTSMRVLAELYIGLHEWRAAQLWLERALELGNDRLALMGYVLHWFRLGEFDRARHFYRARMQDANLDSMRRADIERWQGQPLPGKTLLLIVGDIYFGDALEFARFTRVVKTFGARVILQAPKRLRSLLLTLEGVDGVIAPHDRVPPVDYAVEAFWLLFSLPVPVDEMIGRCPYLHPPENLFAEWRARFARTPGTNVGIVWRGSSYRIRDRFGSRSMRLEDLRPLTGLGAVNLYSLQCGEGRTELLTSSPMFPAIDLAPDFPNTAAAIHALDLVVTIDTSIAHLAGAIGKRTFLMLPYDACFRWMVDRCDTPWYPSLRLFRQSKPGVWSDVVSDVARALLQ